MLSHVFIGTNDFLRAYPLYTALMHELDLTEKFHHRGRVYCRLDGEGCAAASVRIERPL